MEVISFESSGVVAGGHVFMHCSLAQYCDKNKNRY